MNSVVTQNKEKLKNKAGKGFFKNPIMDKFTRTNSFVAIGLFYSVPILLMIYGKLNTSITNLEIAFTFAGGVFFFTFLEYMLHRYLFHMNTDTERRKKIQYSIHGMHHEYPKDKDRLAMPLVASIPLAIVLFMVFYFVLGDFVFGFLPGIMVGYSTYLLVHYAVHAYPPPKNFLRELWINHSIHHYRGDHYAYGVSSPLWDYIFGTMPKKKKEEEV